MQQPTHDSKCRVLYVNHVGEVSGAEASLVSLLSHLRTDRYVPMAAVPMEGPLHSLLREHTSIVERVPALRLHDAKVISQLLRQAGRLLKHRTCLGGVIRRTHPEIVHANSLTAGMSATTWSLGMPPVVCHVRDTTFPKIAAQWVVGGAEAIIAISESVKRAILDAVPEAAQKIHVIYNGIDCKLFKPARPRAEVRELLGVAQDQPLIGSVSQLIPWKRHDLFIDAAAEIAASIPEARFIIVGADVFGEHPKYVAALHEQARRLGIEKRIIWAGYRDDVANLLAAMDVLVHTAEREPLGRVILEALCVGTPCVAVNAGGPAEIIQNMQSGLLVEPRQHDFAEAAITIITKPRLAEAFAAAGKVRVATDFSAEQMARTIERLYLDIQQRRPHRKWPV
jgi:L-malate glycosyltransferase